MKLMLRFFITLIFLNLSIISFSQTDGEMFKLYALLEKASNTNDYGDVLDILDDLIKKYPDSNDLIPLKVAVLIQTDDWEQAYGMMDEALEKMPNNPELLMVRAGLHLEKGDCVKARADLEKTAEVYHSEGEVNTMLAELCRCVGDYDAAMPRYQEALNKMGNDPFMLWSFGLNLKSLGQDEAATEAFRDALDIIRSNKTKDKDYLRTLEANLLFDLGNKEEALKIMAEFGKKNPKNADVAIANATILIFSGEYEESLIWAKRALKQKPKDAMMTLYKGFCLTEIGKLDAAQKVYEGHLAESPDNFFALAYLGKVRMKKGDAVGALAYIEKAKELAPLHPLPYKLRGELWMEKGEYEKALIDLEMAEARAFTVYSRQMKEEFQGMIDTCREKVGNEKMNVSPKGK